MQNDGVVLRDRALGLDREHPIEVLASALTERRSFLGRWLGELAVEFSDIALAEKRIGLLKCADSSQTQLLWQPALPGAETAFTAAARLWRVGRNHLHPELFHGSADLGQPMWIHLFAGLPSHKEMAAPIAIQGPPKAFRYIAFANYPGKTGYRSCPPRNPDVGVLSLGVEVVPDDPPDMIWGT